MYRHNVPMFKRNVMRRRFIEGNYHAHLLARELRVSTVTTYRYQLEFERIRKNYPEQLENMYFYMPEAPRPHQETPLYVQLLPMLPALLAEMGETELKARPAWQLYRRYCPEGYSYSPFKIIFQEWVPENVTVCSALLSEICEKDQAVLTKWRHGNDHRRWQIAVTLLGAAKGKTVMELMDKTDASRRTVNGWLETYRSKGLAGFELSPRKPNAGVVRTIKERKEKLVKLLHETPRNHGLNRTSWSITALTQVYNQLHQPQVTYMQVNRCMQQMGYRYKKTRDMLTSQDPKFREKIAGIQRILQKLKPDEKFFSIDEYGPVFVRIKGGRTLKHETEPPDSVPAVQKSKGMVICTAALELSTNQVTWFYSDRKNSIEMIKLVDVLVKQYQDQSRLYLSWDAVSWHNSILLKKHIEAHNQIGKPQIKLAPLPACTQFLNVIESVFGGLAKAVIHNSNYPSVEDCRAAIDLHFQTRNDYFLAHPKKAGRKIWGQEPVKATFSEVHHTRKRSAMRGVRPGEAE